MSLGEHLIELRNRLFIAGIAIVIACIAGWFLSDWVTEALKEPIRAIAVDQGKTAEFNFDTITGAFDLKLQISLTIGVVVASPVWLFQIWAFLVPGLTRKEVRYGLGFILTAIPLFLAGCAAGWFVFPHIVELMTGFADQGSTSILSAKTYYDFVLKLVLVVGVAFVLPVFLVLLNFVGILPGMTILKSWRIAIMIIVLFCAIATPAADVITMFLLAIPMVVLFFAATGVSIWNDRRKAKRQVDYDDLAASELPA
ncbi:twin-arginine translocase subunit TatC [Microbacteriaceae bacterium VKM Ac-2854]|nr:twin-arginine translocase subunit TatC [Microbacteriaceae bacterium VKM Ac-2854]